MSLSPSLPIAADLKSIRENYDTNNPIVAEIIKAKEERLKILRELNKEQEEKFSSLNLKLTNRYLNDQRNSDFEKKKVGKRKAVKNFPPIAVRRSTRLLNSPSISYSEEEVNFSKSETPKPAIIRPPNEYGPVPGVSVGFHWETRMECSMYGVHRPTVAGIHGGPNGAYSIALSGGYPEDVDEGYTFIYTGAGGRDLKGTSVNPKNLRTAPQTKDQQLEGTNLSLVKSIESKLPVRVIRGYKSSSFYAPESGYRYDGLYQVVKYWADVGKSGHRVYRFKMERMENQSPPPWETNETKRGRTSANSPKNNFFESSKMENFKENFNPESWRSWALQTEENFTNSDADEMSFDDEINKCIECFCKAALKADWKSKILQHDSIESDFLGF